MLRELRYNARTNFVYYMVCVAATGIIAWWNLHGLVSWKRSYCFVNGWNCLLIIVTLSACAMCELMSQVYSCNLRYFGVSYWMELHDFRPCWCWLHVCYMVIRVLYPGRSARHHFSYAKPYSANRTSMQKSWSDEVVNLIVFRGKDTWNCGDPRVEFQMDESSKFFDTFFGEPHITLSPIS